MTARLIALASLACALALPARADVEDLTPRERRTSQEPATFVLRIEGGTSYSVTGNVGGTLSYFNLWSETEVEVSVGLTFPDSGRAWQGGLSLRKLFGDRGDFFVSELALLWTKDAPATDPLNPLVTSNFRICIGAGLEHRAGIWSYGLTGGLALNGVSTAPAPYLHGGIGFGF